MSGVWAARADYLPHTLEPREMNRLLSPRRQGESPSQSTDQLSLGEVGGCEFGESSEGDTPTITEKDKRELEMGIREALFRTPAAASPSERYKGRPLQGVWATSGQTGASVVNKTEGTAANSAPFAKFTLSSPGSSSGCGTPVRGGARTPDSRLSRTPPPFPRQQQGSNWSTPPQNRHGNRGRYRHSKSGPGSELVRDQHQQKTTPPRRAHSEHLSVTDQSNHRSKSRDETHQSEVNNWNIHMPRNRHGNSGDNRRGGRGRGRGAHSDTSWQRNGPSGSRGEGRGRGQGYQRSQSDVVGWTHTRGTPSSRHRNHPHSEPTIREHH